MTQLILDTSNDGIYLPEVIKGAYKPRKEDLGETVTMISGRMVKELRGRVWRISYSRGWFDDTTKNRVLAACERGRQEPITCQFLSPTESDLLTSEFFVVDMQYPTFQWSMEGETPVPMWVNFGVELREVKPHD